MKALIPSLFCLLLIGCNDARRPSGAIEARKDEKTEHATTATSAHAPRERETMRERETTDRTNTGINARDRDTAAKTPLDQNENQSDINITAGIRKKVVAEKMSVDAHNVKIITQDGNVTLRGPVRTAEEKEKIEEIARGVAGAEKVASELEVVDR